MSNNTYNELWIKLVTKVEAIFFSIEMNEIGKSNVHFVEMTKVLLAMMLIEEKDLFRTRKVLIQMLVRPSLHTTLVFRI